MSMGVNRIAQWRWWLSLISTLAVSLALISVAHALMPSFRIIRNALLFWLFPDLSLLTAYCIFWTIVTLIICTVVFFTVKPRRAIVRDVHYLEDALRSNDRRVAARSVEQLTEQITGGRATDQNSTEIRRLISTNITPIKKFLSESKSESSVLLVEAPWGMGKTTSILISINELDKKKTADYRYIYESVFKYTGSLDEFEKDLLSSTEDVLTEWGLNVRVDVSGLIVNLCSSATNRDFSWLLKNIKRRRKNLTTDLIRNINTKFESLPRNKNKRLIIVVDDIDRLQGGDVLEILSLLSVLRRFCFIKLIISADISAVAHHLRAIEMYEPRLFIKKYLPEQTSVKIVGGEDVARTIMENRIRSESKTSSRAKHVDFSPAWAAVAFKLLSDKLRKNSESWDHDLLSEFYWPMGDGDKVPKKVTPDLSIDEGSSIILRAARRMYENTDIDKPTSRTEWEEAGGQLLVKFEGILLCLTKTRMGNDGGLERYRVTDYFTRQDYENYIESWFFEYVRKNWRTFDISMREVTDLMNNKAWPTPLSSEPNIQFTEIFNLLFKDKIHMAKDEEEKE